MANGAIAFSREPVAWGPRPADEVAFRNGLAKLASGVAIVACWADGQPRGLLVSSLTGLSTQPPRILFCVRKAAGAHAALLAAETVSVSLLDEADREEAERFATGDRAAERFGDGRWTLDPRAPPQRQDSLAAFAGPIRSRIDGGTHTVFILDVSQAHARDADPLLYFERAFRRLG